MTSSYAGLVVVGLDRLNTHHIAKREH